MGVHFFIHSSFPFLSLYPLEKTKSEGKSKEEKEREKEKKEKEEEEEEICKRHDAEFVRFVCDRIAISPSSVLDFELFLYDLNVRIFTYPNIAFIHSFIRSFIHFF